MPVRPGNDGPDPREDDRGPVAAGGDAQREWTVYRPAVARDIRPARLQSRRADSAGARCGEVEGKGSDSGREPGDALLSKLWRAGLHLHRPAIGRGRGSLRPVWIALEPGGKPASPGLGLYHDR